MILLTKCEVQSSSHRILNEKWRAIYDYEAADNIEVSFLEGDIIIDGIYIDDGWMKGTIQRTGAFGLIPSNYVKLIE